MFLSAFLDRTFGFTPAPFYAASILIHALCVLLVYASGIWIETGRRLLRSGLPLFSRFRRDIRKL